MQQLSDHGGISADRFAGKDVLFVMAAEAEYGSHLRARILPLQTGIGPVEAAVTVTRALSFLAAQGRLPELVVSLGSAGSRELGQARVYQVAGVSYRDMDASALGFPKGVTPLLDLPARIEFPLHIPGIAAASLATGGSVVSGSGYDAVDAQMVDMETFATLRACQMFGVPLIGLRGISDGVAELSQLQDWTQYLHIVDERLAEALDLLEAALLSESIRLPASGR